MDKLPPEFPVLRLGLVGFNPAQQALFETALVMLRTRLRWRVSALEDADAVCVNGSRSALLPDGSLQIASTTPGGQPVRLALDDSNRPLAFTLPLAADLGNPSTFDMASPASTRAMLEKFEGWLRPVAVRFCLASRIVQMRLDLSATVWHVTVDGRLVAIISRRSGVGVLPIADPFHLETALWSKRPGLADEIPGHFVHAGVGQVLWEYAMRTSRELLPSYFRSGPIYWCRAPQLPQRLFRDSHLMIVREVAQGPVTFAELGRRTGLPEGVLARDLAGLRIVGAVTHDRKQALRAATLSGARPGGNAERTGAPAAALAIARRLRKREQEQGNDVTAPAPLMPQGF